MDYQHTQKSPILLVGLTGGIASGKSTVAHILEEMGSRVIDFDMLARLIVEPGRPAWKKIVDYFGKDILQGNGEIDRKRLSRIIFGNSEKRKRLEGFTHPFIADEFAGQVDEIASNDPDAIINAVVPMLFEAGMRALFHKVIVVYIPREEQIKRLMERDGMSEGDAINILNAQMHIVWDTLRDLQRDIVLKK